MDLMFKALDKKSWDAFAASLPSAEIDEIGEIGRPPTYDEKGQEIAPAVRLEGWHVNVRITGEADFAALAKGGDGVEWVDPDTVEAPARVWAGGMQYWRPE